MADWNDPKLAPLRKWFEKAATEFDGDVPDGLSFALVVWPTGYPQVGLHAIGGEASEAEAHTALKKYLKQAAN